MQTVTLKIKLLPPNKGKLEKMTRMLEIYLLIVNRIDPLCANKIDPLENKNNQH